MTDTVITGAIPHPHDEGLPNITDDSEDWNSAGLQSAANLTQKSNVSYVADDNGARFYNHDGANDTVDITGGVAHLNFDFAKHSKVDVQSTLGGTSVPAYDKTLEEEFYLTVVWGDSDIADIPLDSGIINDVYLAYATDDSLTGVSAGEVYIRSGSSVTEPPHPNVLLGRANPDDSTQDELENRYPPGMFQVGIFEQLDSTPQDEYYFNSDQIAVYGKSDENIYKRPYGGPEEQVGGSASSTDPDAAKIFASTNQTGIAHDTVTQVEFDSSSFNYGGIADVSNNQITIQEDGIYHLSGTTEWQENANWSTGDEMLTRIRINGSFIPGTKLTYRKVGTSYQGIPAASGGFDLNAGDTIDMTVYHLSGSGVSHDLYSGEDKTYLSVSQLQVGTGSGQSWSTVTTTGDYTASAYENVVGDLSSASTITCPTAASDMVFSVKNISTNDMTVATPNTETIDGQNSLSITTQYESYTIYSDGSNYFIR